MTIAERLNEIRRKLKEISKVSDPVLIAVSKIQPFVKIQEALDAGQIHFGENKITEGIEKFSSLQDKKISFQLHHIGPVQTGTLKKLFGLFSFTHGVGSESTLATLARQSEKSRVLLKYFLQANLTEENTKHGFSRKELELILPKISTYESEFLRFEGLMTMGPSDGDPTRTRVAFRTLYELKKDFSPNARLSMGMSGDYMIALEEGSDYVRIGTAVFGERS